MTSAIEWTQRTLNPSTGCDKVSPGCDNCYAATMARRLKAMGQAKYQTDGDPRTSGPGFGFAMHPRVMQAALRRKEPTRYFVNSMSDLFHAHATREFLAEVFAVMALTPRHTYQILTKRPLRMARILTSGPFVEQVRRAAMRIDVLFDDPAGWWPLRNVWLGVSVEDQERADERIPHLLATPAAVRFLSCEPLLGPVDLDSWLFPDPCPAGCGCRWPDDADHRDCGCGGPCCGGDWRPTPGIDWVIIGGESGPGARAMGLDWAQDITDQCRAAGVATFVKQLGSHWAKDHHDIDRFPPALRVREYPTPAPAGTA